MKQDKDYLNTSTVIPRHDLTIKRLLTAPSASAASRPWTNDARRGGSRWDLRELITLGVAGNLKHELFISGIFHVLFSDRGGPRGNQNCGRGTIVLTVRGELSK